MRGLTLRRRFALLCAAAVAIVVVSGSLAAYLLVRSAMRGEIDDNLRATADGITATPGVGGGAAEDGVIPGGPLGGPAVVFRLERSGAAAQEAPAAAGGSGKVGQPPGKVTGQLSQRPPPGLPDLSGFGISRARLDAVASGDVPAFFTDVEVRGTPMRVYVLRTADGAVAQLARPLTEVDRTLDALRLSLGTLSLIVTAIAFAVGSVVSRAAVRPVTQLTVAAEHVARTRDLSRRIAQHGDDEVGRLAATFNGMLAALDASRRSQRQLVADASHELRTPLTSLRTNLEVLASDRLAAPDRERLRADLVTQLEEFSELVGDLVDLARDEEPGLEPAADLRFDELVAASVARARTHAPGVEFRCTLQPTVVTGIAARLDRAVANLLGNAAKFSPPGGVVEVRLAGGELTVRDHGPGISAEALPHVFDRFYRAPEARGQSGSGIGLAIVRQVAQSHGGSVGARNAPGGGAVLRLALPGAAAPDRRGPGAPVPAPSGSATS